MHGHPQDFSVPLRAMDEYGGQMVSQENHRKKKEKKIQLSTDFQFVSRQVYHLLKQETIRFQKSRLE